MLKAKKSLSQNFLIDKNISRKIINLTNLKNKNVLEIGPGYGFMTDQILNKNPNKLLLVKVINKDILKFDFENHENLIIISNLPYNIGTKIILRLFEYNKIINEMIFMVQKEVALKFDYNIKKMNKYKFLTKIVSNYKNCFDVSANVFLPKPKVTSSVVKFKIIKKNYSFDKANNFSKSIFKNVRKKIQNNLNINIKHELLQKRVNQLSINELLDIYNLV